MTLRAFANNLKRLHAHKACLLVLLCAGCAYPSHRVHSGKPVPVQTYSHIAPISVQVGSVEIVNDARGASVPDDFVFSLSEQTQTYLTRKFVSQSVGGRLVVRVEDARVKKSYVPAQDTIPNRLGVGGADQYTLDVRVALDHFDESGRLVFGKTILGQQIVRMPEHCSLSRREETQLEAIEKLFATIDPKLEAIVRQDMRL